MYLHGLRSAHCALPRQADEEKEEKLQQAWKIHVHVKEKVISVSCGSAEQRIKWLGHVGIARWDSENNQGWTKLGVPTQIAKHPDGDILDMAAIIRDVLNDNDHVVVTPSLSGDGDDK